MSIIERAKIELAAINFGEEDSDVMIGILETFFNQWDSGGAVSVVAPVLAMLIDGKPLSPLTGEDSEWHDPMGDGIMLQNVRCSSVFKEWRGADGMLSKEVGRGELLIHDIDAPEPFAPITFPYDPTAEKKATIPWDSPSNRSYEPVEKRAAEIYAAFGYEGPGEKPAWVAGGNSMKQDEARHRARSELRIAGHAKDA